MEKINVAELLKNCPKGMELDCSLWDGVKLEQVREDGRHGYPIVIRTPEHLAYLTEKGQYYCEEGSKCIIFPKGKTSWEGFVPPCKFKDGDIVSFSIFPECTWIGIFKQYEENGKTFETYCTLNGIGEINGLCLKRHSLEGTHLATEEEKQKLFDAIKANGYKWDAETKSLKKLFKPKFKVGDKVRVKNGVSKYRIIDGVFDNFYSLQSFGRIDFTEQDRWELVPEKFDINTLKSFDRVLVRDGNSAKWSIQFFERYNDKDTKYQFICLGYKQHNQCIPFEGNEHLRGTNNDCDEYYKTWEE